MNSATAAPGPMPDADDLNRLAGRLCAAAPAGVEWSLRLVANQGESLAVRDGVVQPPSLGQGCGYHLSVYERGGAGYACSADISAAGARQAFAAAREWAARSARIGLVDDWRERLSAAQGDFVAAVARPWESMDLADKIGLLREACRELQISPRIVDSIAWLSFRREVSIYRNSLGAMLRQSRDFLFPGLSATAHAAGQTQRCTGGGSGSGRLGGLEQAEAQGFPSQAAGIAERAVQLLSAPECPSGRLDLLLLPAQMVLQIHESIGHPLELDRILGDERNYAGTSFVTPDLFGSYRYGSELLNVSFDPHQPQQLASYAYDDYGTPAQREYLIRDGILQRPLGGAVSAARGGFEALACARASGWNRPPIDRMANLNLEPGDTPFAEMLRHVERGVLMDRNRSWSIDDSRNKFQFGCEYGHLIIDGELRDLVRNPGYRGVSSGFWRSLAAVGTADEWEVLGTPNCGKGEPNQLVAVGHASAPCLFRDVEVFGGG